MDGGKCKMWMLWNTQIIDTCVVFRQWHIRSQVDFIFALVAIAALGVLYEYLRIAQASYDRRIAASLAHARSQLGAAPLSLPTSGDGNPAASRAFDAQRLSKIPIQQRVARAALYGSAVFLSFFLMLVFMTYNAYLIGAVVFGAALGHYIFGSHMDPDAILLAGSAPKGVSCH
ncbi:Ctr copper transporter [Auricularia subglabra TFB-10046 SS5]|nr:Ctr copper transporter [Auricularia subglabra TFB-10046 SS5]